MTRFPLRVWRTVRERALLAPGDRVLVAYSGGPDSTALLEVLSQLAPRLGATVVGVAHVHHGLRGEEADADLAWCRVEAERRGLPCLERHVPVADEARRRRWSMERTAHALRHAALHAMADEIDATRLALGHTLDDQAETVLLRFLRGAGSRGLGGMWPRRGRLIRPLIDVSRRDVEQFLAERGLISRTDASNADAAIPRNRVRHEVMPVLTAMAGAKLPARLAAQAEAWRDEDRWIEVSARPWVARAFVPEGTAAWRWSPDEVADAPPALRRRVRLAVARELLGSRVSAEAVTRLVRLEGLRPGRRGRFGRWAVQRTATDLWFRADVEGARDDAGGRFQGATAAAPEVAVEPVVIPVPGAVELTALDVRLEAACRPRDDGDARAWSRRDLVAALDADALPREGLLARTWRPGDRLRPRGLAGSQKVQDLFVNRKVPRADRARVPVVATPDGRVVWVVGLAVDEAFAVRPATTRVVILRATPPGGKA